MASKRTPAGAVALGGILAALAVIIMNLGGLIPIATYTSPVMCMLILQIVLKTCGERYAWAWYGAVAILCLLLAPDREAASVFVGLGYYPILKPRMDRLKGKWFWKALLFNSVILVEYWLMMHIFGMAELAQEFTEMGVAMTVVTLILGNVTFFMLDKLLGKRPRKRNFGVGNHSTKQV